MKPHETTSSVTEFLNMQYGDAMSMDEKSQCHNAIVEFVSVLLEINQQKGIVHVDSE